MQEALICLLVASPEHAREKSGTNGSVPHPIDRLSYWPYLRNPLCGTALYYGC